MRIRRKRRGSSEDGWALVFALLVVFVALTTTSVALTSSLTSRRTSVLNRNEVMAEYRAEAGVEHAKKLLLDSVANWSPAPQAGTVDVQGTTVAYTVTPTGFSTIDTDSAGIRTIVDGYEIEASAEVEGIRATLHRFVNTHATPIFQFAVFYENDLEIHPGPDMRLRGRVHTNGDLYLGGGGTLTLDTNYVRAAGRLYRHRKDDPSRSTGDVLVRRWVENPFDGGEPLELVGMKNRSQMAADGIKTVSGYDSNFDSGYDAELDGDLTGSDDYLPWVLGAAEYWSEPDGYAGGSGSTVRSNEHGTTKARTPGVHTIDMFVEAEGGDHEWNPLLGRHEPVAPGTGSFKKGFFHSTADLSIIGQRDGSWTAYDAAGQDVTADLAGVVSREPFYDARQGGFVNVIEVDVALLNKSGAFPANGLLYASSYDTGTGLDLKGVKLESGEELEGPLTVVSDGAAYVQGDYNTVDKKGASVIGDAINLLSNSWDDRKGLAGVSQLLPASPTTFNVAFISGKDETEVGRYNGGFENLPRFHENWSGVGCTLLGSFVSLWNSRFATGAWRYGGDRYTAPNRFWNYDPAFNVVANLPPYTPMAVSGEDIASW